MDLPTKGSPCDSGAETSMVKPQEVADEIERLRGEVSRLVERQTRMMELLGTTSPEKLLHDLRNLLNERELFKALADQLDS